MGIDYRKLDREHKSIDELKNVVVEAEEKKIEISESDFSAIKKKMIVELQEDRKRWMKKLFNSVEITAVEKATLYVYCHRLLGNIEYEKLQRYLDDYELFTMVQDVEECNKKGFGKHDSVKRIRAYLCLHEEDVDALIKLAMKIFVKEEGGESEFEF